MRLIGGLVFALAASPAFAAETPICVEMSSGLDAAIAKAPDSLGLNNLLFGAAEKGCDDALARLLKAGASRLARNRQGETALAVAARAGRADAIERLLTGAALPERRQIDMPDARGRTPLMLAVHAEREKVAEILLSAGADVAAIDAGGETALTEAAFSGQEKLARALIAGGAKVDSADRSGKSPICYAAARGAAGLVRALLDAGVDARARYGHGLTALMWAAGFSDLAPASQAAETVRLLIARGAEIDAADDRGRSALMISAALNRFETARVLLDAKADRAARDKAGKSAADLAATPEMKALVSPSGG